ncbi:MAG: Arylmalonate decarboxylase [Hyphomicrobiales bacterium]|nr:Arylmalonate decarboxylase [Hyphomicrobiales bacterium]
MSRTPTIGLVVPWAHDKVPDEGPIMYPHARFIPRGTGVGSLTPEGYDQAADKIVPAADDLARQGVDAIMVVGTSLTFYRGPQFNEDLQAEIRARTGLPVSTMSTAIVEGLRAVGATKLAVATAYSEVVNQKLEDLLAFHGFDVEALASFGITTFGGAAGAKSEDEIIELTAGACASAPSADGVLISCGGLRTLGVAQPLEARFNLPVVSSMPACFWAAMRLVGERGDMAGRGRMLQDAPAPA